MTPPADRAIEPLPPALSSMWRLCKLAYRHEPRMTLHHHSDSASHDKPMGLDGWYRTMFDLQAQRFNVPDEGRHYV